MTTEVVPYEKQIGALTVGDVKAQVNLIQHILREVMIEGHHYGKIPGTDKPSLLKAGAEKLNLTFRFDPQYETTEKYDGLHLTVVSKCTLWHIPSGQRFGSGMGSCSTRESKYAYRQGGVKCPKCGKEAIIKGKDFKNDGLPTGWICFSKKGGCGSKFLDGDQAIESQSRGRVPNEDIADQYNTVLKMANKRSLVAAVLNTTAASDIFTQDMEDTIPVAEVTPIKESPLDQLKAALKEKGISEQKFLEVANRKSDEANKLSSIDEIADEDIPNAIKWASQQKKAA